MDESFLPIAVLFLLLTGTHEQDVLNELTESQIGSPGILFFFYCSKGTLILCKK